MRLNLRIFLCLVAAIIPLYTVMEVSKQNFEKSSSEVASRLRSIDFIVDETFLEVRKTRVEMKMNVDQVDLEHVFEELKYPEGRQAALLAVEPLMHNPDYCFTTAYHSPFDRSPSSGDTIGSKRHGSFVPKSGWVPLDDKATKPSSEKIHWIFYVHTSVENFQHRQAIRKTWGFPRLFKDYNMRILFVVGKNEVESQQQRLDLEFALYGDILQGDFMDTYKNLTYKGVFALRWLSTYCSHVPIVMKADDDTFVNIFHVKKYLIRHSDFDSATDKDEEDEKTGDEQLPLVRRNTPKTLGPILKSSARSIICNVYDSKTMPILRDKKNCLKWCVSKMDLPGMAYYPKYCAGLIYFITMPLVKRLCDVVKTTPFLWVDDVYVTGLLPGSVKNIRYVNIKKETTLESLNATVMYKNISQPLTHHVVHARNLDHFAMLWNSLLRRLNDTEVKELTLPPDELKLKLTIL